MERLTKVLLGVVLMVPLAATAASDMAGMGSVSAYVTKEKLNIPAVPESESDTGFGVKGWYSFGIPFAAFEYTCCVTTGDDVTIPQIKSSQWRLGGGATLPVTREFLALGKLEYVSMKNENNFLAGGAGSEDADLKGLGIHFGGVFMPMPQLHFLATVGYLALKAGDPNSNGLGKTKGLEYNIGAGYNFTKEWGAFLDYRAWNGKFEETAGGPSDRSFKVSDIRIGGTFNFGGK